MLYRLSTMAVLLTASLFASPTRAESNSTLLAEKLKTSLNQMVQKVQQAENPETKRTILSDYLTKMETGLKEIQAKPSINAQDKQTLAALEEKFQKHLSILEGTEGNDAVVDGDLDAFAGSVQQSMEQAGFSGGGFYISTGALIIIILLLIIIF